MTTENSFSKLTHALSADVNLKQVHGVADILKEIFRYIAEGNLAGITNLLEKNNNGLAEKSLNITLSKAFSAYKSTNRESKDIIGILLKYKADPNINIDTKNLSKDKRASNGNFTGLMMAAVENDVYLANILINYNCNVNIKDYLNRNALFYAVNSGINQDVSEMVSLLVKSGIDKNQIDSEGNSVLTLAVSKGLKEVIRILLNSGVEIDYQNPKEGNTALHLAVSQNKSEIINLLLLKKPNLSIKNRIGLTPVDIAFNLSQTEVYQILAEEYHQREKESKRIEENIPLISNSQSYGNLTSNDIITQNDSHTSNSGTEIILDENIIKDEEEIHNLRSGMNPNSTSNIINNPNYHSAYNNNNNNNNNKYYNQGNNPYPMNQMNNNYMYQNMCMNPPYNSTTNQFSGSLNNININNLTNHNTYGNRSGLPLQYKCTKNAKLQKLKLLQENRLYAEQNGLSIKDKSFKFPFGQAQSNTNIEIPFNFQTNQEGKIGTGKQTKTSQLHTFIKIQSTPVLHIDISDENKQDQFILTSQIEELKINNNVHVKKINQIEMEMNMAIDENTSLKIELNRLKEELLNKDKLLSQVSIEMNLNKDQYLNTIDDLKNKYEDKEANFKNLYIKFELLEKELVELKNKESFSKLQIDLKGNIKENQLVCKKEYLEKKFSCIKYEEKYIIKCLQKDIIDFQDYTKEQIKKGKTTQEELIKLIQDAVDDVLPEYEVKLYGSHATNLCLQWSDLDVVLVHKKNHNVSSYQFLQSLYLNLYDKPWKKSIKLIDSAVVPIIKMTSTEQFNNMHIDISLQDSKHYGLKCVELVRSFMKEYEALEPLIFALKNILKNANLNDPYTGGLSSYGLILMVVSFLQSQQENKKSIKISDGNLGRMFLEFLWYYGLMFDHTKYVIYAFPTNEVTPDKDSLNFLYNMQPSHELIIVDPLSKTNNVARSTYQFVNIKMAFMIGFVVSHEECECGCHFMKLGDEHCVYNSDHCILKRIFNSVKRFNASTPNQ